ncbi:MAG: 30S ribosomal protein S21 [Planctomycetes bacterium RIFCSPHIGHO2_12_39_6]|nr:MAG: 30S ribosomal protein S21 [Planctomycetes bacterium RIFCSPHIGHO2_12_39_6]
MTTYRLKGESIENLIKRFKKQCALDGTVQDYRSRVFFKTKKEKRSFKALKSKQ